MLFDEIAIVWQADADDVRVPETRTVTRTDARPAAPALAPAQGPLSAPAVPGKSANGPPLEVASGCEDRAASEASVVQKEDSRAINGVGTTYAYDAAGRLVNATGAQAGTWSLTDGGTPLGITGTGGATFTMFAGTHRAKTVTDPTGVWNYDYDAAGRVTSTYKLSAKGARKNETPFEYDALGRPLMADGRVTRLMAHDGSVPVEYEDGKWIHRLGSWEKVQNEGRTQVGAAGLPVARIHNGKKLFAVMTDAQGTPFRVYKSDGTLQDDLNVDVYGHEVTASGGGKNIAHHWLGLSRSRKLGITSTAARLYEARSSLFLSPDPMMLHTGAIGLAADPYMSNVYAYGRWSGSTVSDPNGECGFSVVACAVGQKLSGAETTQQAISDPWFWGGYAAVPVVGSAAFFGGEIAAGGAAVVNATYTSAPLWAQGLASRAAAVVTDIAASEAGYTAGLGGAAAAGGTTWGRSLGMSADDAAHAARIRPIPGFQDVAIHADELGFYASRVGAEISPQSLARRTLAVGDTGEAVRLVACRGACGRAQEYATALGRDVLAATGDIEQRGSELWVETSAGVWEHAMDANSPGWVLLSP